MKEKNRILSTVSIYHALNDGSVAVIAILFPIFKSSFNLSYTQIGIITGGGLFINLVAQLIIGRIADGKSSRIFLSIGILLISISLLLLAHSKDFLSLLLFIFILRFSSSFFHPIGVGWISRVFKRDKLDWAMGIQSGSADLGAFIALSTTLYLTDIRFWDFPLYLWSILGIIGLITGTAITQKVRHSYIFVKKETEKQSFKEALEEAIHFLKKIKLLVPAFMIGGAALGVIFNFLPLLLNEKTDLSLSAIGLIVALWIGMGSMASFFYGKTSSLIGRKVVVTLAYLTVGVMGILLSFFTNTIIILLIMVFLGISVFLTFPALFSYVSEVTHESVEGRTFGIIFTLQLGGGTLISFLSGALSDIFGIWIPFALLGMLSILFTGVLLVNYKKPFVSL